MVHEPFVTMNTTHALAHVQLANGQYICTRTNNLIYGGVFRPNVYGFSLVYVEKYTFIVLAAYCGLIYRKRNRMYIVYIHIYECVLPSFHYEKFSIKCIQMICLTQTVYIGNKKIYIYTQKKLFNWVEKWEFEGSS